MKNNRNVDLSIQTKILSNISDVFVIIDKNGQITYQTPNIEKFFGWKPEELIGQPVWQNIYSKDLKPTKELFKNLLAEFNATGSVECRYLCKDGTFKWISFTGTNLLNDSDINGILGVYQDIDDKKNAESVAKENNTMFRALFNNLSSVASLYKCITDKNGKSIDYRFLSVNNFYEQAIGLTEKELVGKTLLEVFPQTKKVWLDALEKVYQDGSTITLIDYAKEVNKYDELVIYRPQSDMVAMIGTDITERKLTEKLLKENEEKYRCIVEGLNESIYRMSLPDGIYEYFSSSVLNVFGYSAKDFISNPLLIKKIIHPDFNDYFKEEYTKLLKGEVSPTYEYKIIDPNGEDRWIFQSNKGIFDDEGKIIAIEGLCRDITKQKKAEQALIQSEAILKANLEAMDEGVLIVNSEGKITHSNRRFKEIFSIPDSLISKQDDKILIDHAKDQLIDPKTFTKSIERIYKSELSSEDILYFKDGSIIERLSHYLPEKSKTNGRVWLFRDITEKKQYEENLNKFKAAIDNTMDGVYWVNEEGGFDYINNRACKMLGYSHDEMIKLKLPDIAASVSLDDHRIIWERLNNNKKIEWYRIESIQRKKDGTYLPVEVSSLFIWMDNRGLLMSYVKDISERKKYEEALLKNQRLLTETQRIAKIGSWILELDTFQIEWSNETYEIFGYQNNDTPITLDIFYSHVHKDDLEYVKNVVNKALEINKLEDIEYRIIKKDQKVRFVLLVGEFTSSNIMGAIQDITERKLAREEHIKSALEKEMLMKSMASAFVMWEPVFDKKNKIIDVRFAYINDAYEKMTGVKLEQVQGKRILEVWPNTEHEWFEIFNEIIKTGISKSFEKYFAPTNRYYSCNAYLPWKTHDRICVIFEDVTERIETNLAIRQKDAMFRTLFDNLTSASSIYKVITDDKGKPVDYCFITVNTEYEKLAGLKESQLIGKTILEVFPNTEKVWLENLDKVFLTGTPVKLEEYASEVNKYLELVIYRPGEDMVAIIGTDVTKRRLSEQEVIKAKERAEESEFFLQESQKTGNIGSYNMDFKTGYWISTETMNNIFGIDDSYDKTTTGWLDIVHPEDRETIGNYFENEVIGKKQKFYKEYRIVRKNNNETRWVHGIGKLYFDNDGNLTYMLGTIQDITLQKIAEEALKESEERARLFIENAPLPIAMFDTNMCYLMASKRWSVDYKLGDQKIIGRSHYDVFPEIPDRWKDDHQRVLKGEIYRNDADKFVRLDGSIQWLRYVLHPWYKNNGSIGGLIMFTEDITSYKQIEEELQMMNAELEKRVQQRTKQLQQANQELEAFAYSVSHDLRAPLRHISGFLSLLQNSLKKGDSKVFDHLEKIELSSKNMSVLIDELLKFSRLGRAELNYKNIKLGILIEEIVEQFKPDYTNRKINWKINNLSSIKGDPSLIKFVFENIISNAIKYTAQEKVTKIEIGEQKSSNKSATVYVKDNGVGFDMAYKDKIFGVFQRLHSQNDFEGVGIGLANVNRIIAKHNGIIDVTSKVNEGTTFFITLPK